MRILPVLLTLLVGCAAKVQVQVQPTPAVRIEDDTIAVVAGDRRCRPFADALLEEFARLDGLRVHPRSDLRVVVFSCGSYQQVVVDERVEGLEQHGLAGIDGRAHAVVAVSDGGRVVAHLLGTSRAGLASDIDRSGPDLPAMGRTVRQKLVDAVATDLALQLNPDSHRVTRRVYPKAPEGSARNLYTRAVAAEAEGDLERAYALAVTAARERPTQRTSRYVLALERQLSTELSVRRRPPALDMNR